MSTRSEAGNPGLTTTDSRLVDLAEALDYNLADRLRDLVAADSMAHRVDDLVKRCERAEDLIAEFRRQMPVLERQLGQARDRIKLLERRAGA